MSASEDDRPLTGRQRKAAALLASGQLAQVAVAEAVGVTDRAIRRWQHRPAFAAAVAEIQERERAALEAKGIADRKNRVAALDRRWRALQAIVDARAADPKMAKLPGGATGLLVRQLRALKTGRFTTRIVVEVALDDALLAELRGHEKQAAIELGQWEEKHQITEPARREDATDEPFDWDAYRAALDGLGHAGGAGTPDDGAGQPVDPEPADGAAGGVS